MNRFLNNAIKGLFTALVIVTMGGFLSLKMQIPSTKSMTLISSSIANTIKTDNALVKEDKKIEVKEDIEEIKEDTKIEEDVVEKQEEIKQEEIKQEEVKKEEVVETPKVEVKEEIKEEVVTPPLQEKPKEVEIQGSYTPTTTDGSVLASYYGNITAYGPDCVGCGGLTASGYNVSNGNIYYQDATYGNIRVVAADRSLPFGTIVKLTGLNISADPIIAIVLDRGGAIGFNKDIYIDLLYPSEKSTYSFGKQKATIDVLRMGY